MSPQQALPSRVHISYPGLCASAVSADCQSTVTPSHLVLSVASRDFTPSFQWLASEAKPLCQRGSPSAPLLLLLGIIHPLLLSPLLGAMENACLSQQALWSGIEGLQPRDLQPAIRPSVSFTPPGCTKNCSCSWSRRKMRRWLFKENSYLFDTKSPVNILM